jgi:hypothetical protein
MKTEKIVHHLKAVLPKYTDDFSDSINITNVTTNGNNITYTLSANHHIQNNDTFLVCDIKNYYNIISLKKYNNIAIALTDSAHNIIKTQSKVEIAGASDVKHNGIKDLYSLSSLTFKVSSFIVNNNDTITITTTENNPFIVNQNYKINVNNNFVSVKSIVNSTTFTIDNFFGIASDTKLTEVILPASNHLFFYIIDQTANENPTGSIKLLEKRNYGYNGYKLVASHTHNTITCVASNLYGQPYIANNLAGVLKKNIRIIGVSDYERAKEIFLGGIDATNQAKSWLFVYTLARMAGKDPNGKTDINVENFLGTNLSVKLIQGLELCAMINLGESASSIGLAYEKDKVSDYLVAICKSIAGYIPDSPFGNVGYHKLTPIVDQIKESEKSFYSHVFLFETAIDFTNDLEIAEYDTTALTNIAFDLKDANNSNTMFNLNLSF